MDEQTEEFKPVLKGKRWDGVVATWHTMQAQSNETDEGQVWDGYISKLMGFMGLSASYGTQIVRDLVRIGSVEVLEEGARGKLTRIKLVQPPNEDRFLDYKDGLFAVLTPDEQEAARKQQIEFDIIAKVDELERTLNTVIEELNKLSDKLEYHMDYHFPTED